MSDDGHGWEIWDQFVLNQHYKLPFPFDLHRPVFQTSMDPRKKEGNYEFLQVRIIQLK